MRIRIVVLSGLSDIRAGPVFLCRRRVRLDRARLHWRADAVRRQRRRAELVLWHRRSRRVQEGPVLPLSGAVAPRSADGAHPITLDVAQSRGADDTRARVQRRGRGRAVRQRPVGGPRQAPRRVGVSLPLGQCQVCARRAAGCGVLRAVAYKNSAQWAVDSRRTAGDAAALNVTVDRASIAGDGVDLAYVTVAAVDANGTVVPRASHTVIFSVSGPGRFVASDNGDPTDMTAFPSTSRKVFRVLRWGL